MQNLSDKTAVVTGAASGIGRAMADCFAAQGMNVVIADVEEPALDAAADDLAETGAKVLPVVTDVSDAKAMDHLAEQAYAEFGSVELLCNNAGVAGGGLIQDMTVRDWEWVLGVNLWGVIHGHRVFLPRMIEQNQGHIVNTASILGHLSLPSTGAYNATKHAVVSISETLFAEMNQQEVNVGVTVLCPSLVNTQILDSSRNRPEKLLNPDAEPRTEEEELVFAAAKEIWQAAKEPADVAEQVLQAVLDNQLYLFTDGEYAEQIAQRHRNIEASSNPGDPGSLFG